VRLVVRDVTTTQGTSGIDFRIAPQTDASTTLVVTSYIANDTGTSPFPSTVGQAYASVRGFGYATGPSDDAVIVKLAPASAADLTPE
jgi:hypothetical protein